MSYDLFPQPGQVQATTKLTETLVIINSKDRVSGTSSSFNYQPESFTLGNIKMFRVNKITIPYSFYNLKQQTFTVSVNSGPPVTITLPAGSYSAQSLANTLNAIINPLISQPVNITYDQNTDKFTFTMTSPNTIALNFNASGLTSDQFGYSLQKTLGFSSPVPTSGIIVTSDLVANLNASSNLYIQSLTLCTAIPSYFIKKRSQVIQSIPIYVNSFNYIIWENRQQTYFKYDDRSIMNIDITILDDYGNIIDLNGQDIVIEFQMFS